LTSRHLARSHLASTVASSVAPAGELLGLFKEALAAHRAGQLDEAIALYERILTLNSAIAPVHNHLGRALAALGRFDAAAATYRRAIELNSDDAEAYSNWGIALWELDRFDEAEAKFRRAIVVDPGYASAHNSLGLLLKERGRIAEARKAAKRAIRLESNNTCYYANLAAVRPFAEHDRYFSTLRTLARDAASLPDADRIHLHFALAKAYEDISKPENAFPHLLHGNAIKRRQIAYDEAGALGRMDRMRQTISGDFIKARQGSGDPSPLPVFIVGMPRSGTTLIEQILASHPGIFGAGELHLFDQAAGAIRDMLPGAPPFPEMMLDMSAAHFRASGALYLRKLAPRAPNAARITDKMTVNFLFAGLIHLALPNAAIIHAVRDPIDTCVSCFAVHFTEGQQHTYDLAELGRYYRHYRALMQHWHRVLPPGRIMDVQYEELIGDLEGVARRLVAHCGLPWDDSCLNFHRTERPVRTASATQVRRPIYRDSIGRWRKVENFLGPLLAELNAPSAC
jgi:tetratricopeptide (TPR) repeat protein